MPFSYGKQRSPSGGGLLESLLPAPWDTRCLA